MTAGTLPPLGGGALAAVGVLITGGVAVLTWRSRLDLGSELFRRLSWLGVASLTCLIPMAGGFIGGRMLPLASIGPAAVLDGTLDVLWRRAKANIGTNRWLTYALASLLAALHLGLAPLVRLAMPLAFLQMERGERKLAREAEIDACPSGSTAYLLPGSDPTVALYARSVALAFFEPDAHRPKFNCASSAGPTRPASYTGTPGPCVACHFPPAQASRSRMSPAQWDFEVGVEPW